MEKITEITELAATKGLRVTREEITCGMKITLKLLQDGKTLGSFQRRFYGDEQNVLRKLYEEVMHFLQHCPKYL